MKISESDNIFEIIEAIQKSFNPITLRTKPIKLKYKFNDYTINISMIKSRDLLLTCTNDVQYYATTIHQTSLNSFNPKFNEFKNMGDLYNYIIQIIDENILSLKVFPDINVALICLTDKMSNDTIFQFFLRKLTNLTINNDILKMLFKKKADQESENDIYISVMNKILPGYKLYWA